MAQTLFEQFGDFKGIISVKFGENYYFFFAEKGPTGVEPSCPKLL